ncbi:peptidoglycan editing factor PgeF [Salinarimonas rosea]|uniref:peptidoglycan editing factor PgeF n=1 Tax=Salinarimonas rosea TaxID=552063 RepID=UPI0004066B97|nr:peptidoglycan editing factor PgeF [Salinarimonas rosea]
MLITSDALDAANGVRHAFFTRDGGVSQGLYASLNGGLGSADARERVVANRARMAERLGVAPDALVSVHQVHSPDVVVVEAPIALDARPKADAMVTDRPGLALAILTADCGPVLFADPEAGVIGAAHAGWRGALGGVAEATVAAMERLGARRGRIVAVLGPTIGQGAYEVGAELREAFLGEDPDAERYFAPGTREGKWQLDLPGYILARLARAEVGTAHDLARCTYSDEDRFYSYRRSTHRGEPDYGRLVSAIALAP